MANLKRRPDRELNHDNWDQEDDPEEKGEFKKANEDDLMNRKIIKPRRKLNTGTAGASASSSSSNPFSAFAFAGAGVGSIPSATTSGFNFGIPAALPTSTFSGAGGSDAAAASSTPGGTGSLFKLAGITPSAEPPTKASADSSTADTPGRAEATSGAAAVGGGQKQDDAEPEVGSISESEGITEESSNSSSLPWNVSSRQQENEAREERGADSMQSLKPRSDNGDLNQDNWPEEEESVEKATSAEAMQSRKVGQASTGPADSSESSSASNPNPTTTAGRNPFSSFSFGSSFGGGPAAGSLFQPFASASAAVSQSQNAAAAAAGLSAATSSTPQQPSQLASGGDTRSPESSGILVRSSIEDDSADYENDTTSSSNNLLNSNEVSNDYQDNDGGAADNEDREAEADCEGVNDDREAEGVDS